ncbi:hypothetical protein TL16_g04258 [Triparma laevis f. inornata]|uniref:Calcium-regulated actin-bundling protein C-terminal domain-containing protein n=1 Tax=Triparma laevis f. inornata TaxID=1714386 RepID=A0A9W7E4C3_9STRA|nr:hypothetical protein TL16_g04258 [Triparma laevis f. inornata]
MSAFDAKSDMEKLSHINALPYKEQAIWFLNAFWSQGPKFGEDAAAREDVWTFHKTSVKLDKANGEAGNELNEFDAHRLIEKCDSALTVQKMREVLKEIDVDFNKMVSLSEFMIYKFGIDWTLLVNAPQGCDMGAINEAQAGLDNANKMMQVAIAAAEKAKDDHVASKLAEERSKEEEVNSAKAAEESKKMEIVLAEAKEQAEGALKELQEQEAAFKKKLDDLEATSTDDSLGIVKRNKAKAELAMAKAEDPMPLRMAKIHQEAAVRKVTKATVKAGAATAAAETAAKHAVEARINSEKAAVEASAAAKAAEAAIPDAEAILEEVKQKNSGSGEGNLWYIDRELEEAKRYLPKSKFAAAQAAAAAAKQQAASPMK